MRVIFLHKSDKLWLRVGDERVLILISEHNKAKGAKIAIHAGQAVALEHEQGPRETPPPDLRMD